MSTYIDQIIIYLEVTLKETHYYLDHIRSTHSSYLNFKQFDYQFQYLTPSITLFQNKKLYDRFMMKNKKLQFY
jgi:hypothetical protein